MKKICYLLCMICTLGVFNACSDDDDNMDQGIPVTEIVVPAKVQAGSELIIAGNGFSSGCKILLKNAAGSTELVVSERLSSSISCTVPVTLATGEYTVVLVQSGEWPLRKITVLEEGAGNPDLPVTALVFPSDPVKAGKEVSIQGIGFARECEIDLKVGEELQKMEITVSNNGVKFTLPEMLAAGTYPVILKQDKGQWSLGDITVEAEAVPQKTQIDQIIEKWNKKGKDHVVVNSYSYNTDGKLSSIETIYDGDKDSRLDFKWEAGNLTVDMNYWDAEVGEYYADMSYEYIIGEDGNVASTEESGDWAYASGYLKSFGAFEYTYGADNRINTCTYNDQDWPDEYSFEYETGQSHKCAVDLMGEVLYRCTVEGEEQYYARLAGACGQAPGLLPSSVASEMGGVLGSMTYDTYPDGYLQKITFDDGHVLEVTYK